MTTAEKELLIFKLSRLDELLTSLCFDRQIFLSNYNRWKIQRQKTLLVLAKLEKELDKIYFNCCYGKLIGHGMSILGGIATIAGLVCSFSGNEFTRSTGQELRKFGTATGVLGGVTSIGSSVVECRLNQTILDEAKAALKRDEELTQLLMPWFERSEELDELFQEVFHCSITSSTVQDIFTAMAEVNVLKEEGNKIWGVISNIVLSGVQLFTKNNFKNGNLEKIIENYQDEVKFLLREYYDNPKVRIALMKIYNSFNQLPVVFEFLKFSSSKDALLTSHSLVKEFVKDSGIMIVSECLFRGVKIAIDILAILSIAEDMNTKISKYSKMLGNVKIILTVEFETISQLYISIKNLSD